MKPSERANDIWDEYSVTVVKLPNPMLKKIQDAIEAAEREAFEAGVRWGRMWSEGDLDGEYEIAKVPTYEDWQKVRTDAT